MEYAERSPQDSDFEMLQDFWGLKEVSTTEINKRAQPVIYKGKKAPYARNYEFYPSLDPGPPDWTRSHVMSWGGRAGAGKMS